MDTDGRPSLAPTAPQKRTADGIHRPRQQERPTLARVAAHIRAGMRRAEIRQRPAQHGFKDAEVALRHGGRAAAVIAPALEQIVHPILDGSRDRRRVHAGFLGLRDEAIYLRAVPVAHERVDKNQPRFLARDEIEREGVRSRRDVEERAFLLLLLRRRVAGRGLLQHHRHHHLDWEFRQTALRPERAP